MVDREPTEISTVSELTDMLSIEDSSQLRDCACLIPRYLFRTYSESSQGINACPRFLSQATVKGVHHSSIYDIPKEEARFMIENHLVWGRESTEFISWTSSLLWALQYAVRKRAKWKDQNISICVLDIRRQAAAPVQQQLSIYPVPNLLCVYDIPGRGRDNYYHAEYLAHSIVEVSSGGGGSSSSLNAISFEALISAGLFELLPELDDRCGRVLLAKRVTQLRSAFFTHPCKVSPKELLVVKRLAAGFGSDWILPMSLAFLSLRLRERKDEDLLRVIAPLAYSYTQPRLEYLFPPHPNLTHPIVPEVAEFARLIDEVYQHIFASSTRRPLNNIAVNALQRLSLATSTINITPAEQSYTEVLNMIQLVSEREYLEAVCGDWSDYDEGEDHQDKDDDEHDQQPPKKCNLERKSTPLSLMVWVREVYTYFCNKSLLSSTLFSTEEELDDSSPRR